MKMRVIQKKLKEKNKIKLIDEKLGIEISNICSYLLFI